MVYMKYDLILIDGMHLMHRAAHSYRELGVYRGDHFFPTGCIYGFIFLATNVWKKHGNPHSRLVVCWDAGYDHRTALYPLYKANRRVAREEGEASSIPAQKTALQRILRVAGWAQAVSPGFEADDVMGTLASQEKGSVAIYTGDQDLHQMVCDRTHVISASKGKEVIWDIAKVQWEGLEKSHDHKTSTRKYYAHKSISGSRNYRRVHSSFRRAR